MKTTAIHEYHRKQYQEPYRSTLRMMEFIEKVLGQAPSGALLDAACGGGANLYHMSSRWPQMQLTGVDHDAALVAFGRSQAQAADRPRLRFLEGDLFKMDQQFAARSFDVVTFLQTLFLFDLEAYPKVLGNLLKCARRWVFVSSLFAESNMDVVSRIHDYTRFGDKPDGFFTYVILDQKRFEQRCLQLGAKAVHFEDFWIDVDLDPPAAGGIGTFTRRDAEGRRLQFSGAVFMPWKMAAIQMD
jgi:hypothetical protein